ncbi:MAG: NUMOD4 motif-containing HNH endonuclease [Bacteroidales bacterium]|nr:NUMOD4 motif-containing HNH endonuclease [Bacteroidales bacterium]
MEVEKWKDIEGYEGKYQVSTLGRVRSLNYIRKGMISELRQGRGKKRYNKVVLYMDGKPKTYYVHRLVIQTFLGQAPEGKPCVDHIDGNFLNNKLSNLRYVSYKENANNPSTRRKYLEVINSPEFQERKKRAIMRKKAVLLM